MTTVLPRIDEPTRMQTAQPPDRVDELNHRVQAAELHLYHGQLPCPRSAATHWHNPSSPA